VTIRLAVFDCDGTLVDGQAQHCDAMVEAFALAGLPAPDLHLARRLIGISLPQTMARLAPQADRETLGNLVDAYKQSYRQARAEGRLQEPLFAGIADLLIGLHGANWALGVATGKSDRGLKHCLAVHGLSDLFTTLQTADRHPSKPHPSMLEQAMADAFAIPQTSVMIGDTSYDMEMARNIGVRALGVAWGYHSGEELLDAGAEAVAQSVAELKELLHAA
jgi:phosphoglycolate phosphatase